MRPVTKCPSCGADVLRDAYCVATPTCRASARLLVVRGAMNERRRLGLRVIA